LLATDVQSITYPDDRDADTAQVRQMLGRAFETYQANKRYVRKDGRVVWTQLSGSLVWLQSGEPHYFIYQIQDITDRVNAERALRASEDDSLHRRSHPGMIWESMLTASIPSAVRRRRRSWGFHRIS